MLSICIVASIIIRPVSAQETSTYQGPIPRITSGFGADGMFQVDTVRFPAIGWDSASTGLPLSGMARNVEVWYPRGSTSPRPTLLFAHGFGGNNPNFYGELLRNCVSRGYTVVFVPYPVSINFASLYRTLDSGFTEAVRRFPMLIDSTRIGFAGHSFGAGALPSLAYKAFVQRNWGTRGKFLFSMAPWYSLEISQQQLRSFPADTKLIMQIYADDAINDHRMAMDIFLNISIPDDNKDFVTVFADTVQGYIYEAGHGVCTMNTPTGGRFDAYDYYAVFRLLDALMQYTFDTTNKAAKNVALGNGSAEQVSMGSIEGRLIRPLSVTDRPNPLPNAPRPQFQCNQVLNPRRGFCGLQVLSVTQESQSVRAYIAPQPASEQVYVRIGLKHPAAVTVSITDVLGVEHLHMPLGILNIGEYECVVPVVAFANGLYFCHIRTYEYDCTLPLLIRR
ncbi:MAG: alpha/beta hydrolase [Bacteroidota bacterium]|nr:alpha/beta hydrolase [Bacteroidota bacterium]